VSNDKLYREGLRVERDSVGTAHPFIVTSFIVKRGGEVVTAPAPRENPLTHPFPPRLRP